MKARVKMKASRASSSHVLRGVIVALGGVASVFGTALSRVASACTYFVCVVGRDWSINNRLHGEGQATHSGKQKLR